MIDRFQDYLLRITDKRKATAEELDMYRPLENGKTAVHIEGRVFILNSEDVEDHLDATEKIMAENDNPFWDEAENAPEDSGNLPETVDHRQFQTPIKDQQDRGTCVCFASLANIESIIKRNEDREIDLSEQYANWLFMKEEGRNHCDDGLVTTLSARYLSNNGVCEESDYPYEDQDAVKTHCLDIPAIGIQQKATYGIGNFVLIDNLGFFGTEH